MSIAKSIRILLFGVTAVIVAWAFVDVGLRAVRARQAEREHPIQLTVMHWGDPAEDKIVDDLCTRYQAEHAKVQIRRINAGGDFENKLKTMLAAGTPPDVFYLSPTLLPELASMKLIEPLEERYAKEPAGWRDDFYPLLIDAFRYNADTGLIGQGGKLYGLPKDFTPAVMYVNVDLFKQAGVEVPYGGWTWPQYEAAMKKLSALNGKPGFEGRTIYGGTLEFWPDTFRDILWTFGADFFGPGGFRDIALDSPAALEAMSLYVRTRLVDKTVFNTTGVGKDGGQEFFNGNIGCDGPLGRWKSPRFKDIKAFKWDIVPMPYKETPASILFYTAWTMSSQSPHREECYDLIKFLCDKDGQVQQARAGLAVPCLQSVANSDDFLSPPGFPKVNTRAFLDAMRFARLQQLPREAEFGRAVNDIIPSALQLGTATPKEAAERVRTTWLDELNSPLRVKQWSPMNWTTVWGVTLSIAATILAGLWYKARREKLGAIDRAQERAGWMFVAPWVIGFLVLTLGPMIVSLLLSVSRWNGMVPFAAAESVGTANYRQLLTNDPTFFQSLKVTGYYVLIAVPVFQIAALCVALLMNMRVRGITLFRTVYFVPSVVTGVALSVLWLQLFNNEYGVINHALAPLAHLFGTKPPDWLGTDARRWGVPAFVIMNIWGVGGGMIIYLAGLKGIPQSLYEAARMDGAGPLRRLWNVTLPMLSPLIFYNLVMGIIGSFQIFTQVYVMTAGGPDNATMVYVLNLYRQAFEFHNMGYASAMAWVLFVIVLLLTAFVFLGSKKLVYYEGLKN